MKQYKFFSAAIALVLIAFLTTSWVSPPREHRSRPVTITAVYDFSTFPNVSGTFTTSGALNISGTSTMEVHPYANGTKAHCVVKLITPDGTITIHQSCVLAATPSYGRWKIVSGTGDYENLKGSGSLLMPPNTEAMTGVIHKEGEESEEDD